VAAAPSRQRQIETLLTEGDALLEGGDVEGARASYEGAFERGSGEAARRMAETFDPRSNAAPAAPPSPQEAILWYQDAARKGDRRAKAELTELESWLETSAASGDREARRVLDAWRQPAEPAGSDAEPTP
jgi:TPR repeat protein